MRTQEISETQARTLLLYGSTRHGRRVLELQGPGESVCWYISASNGANKIEFRRKLYFLKRKKILIHGFELAD